MNAPHAALVLLLVAQAAMLSSHSYAEDYQYYREEFRLHTPNAGRRGLESVIVRPSEPGRYPLVVISHGTTESSTSRQAMTPLAYIPQALTFARRGWAAVIVMRHSFGDSKGAYLEAPGSCERPHHLEAARSVASDLRAIIAALAARSDIDASRVIAVGESAGGFASLALAADPPPGLSAVINFAGGMGAIEKNGSWTICNESELAEAFRIMGKSTRIPTLWVYSENDHLVKPEQAEKWSAAFASGGGQVQLIKAPPFGDDGHDLFRFARGISTWMPHVDRFLQEHALAPRQTLLPRVVSKAVPPPEMSSQERGGFAAYLDAAPHKALVIAPDGRIAWQAGERTQERAKTMALESCKKFGLECRVVSVDEISP